MWNLIFILLFSSQIQAMQPGLEYHYHYKGTLASGITEMRRQYAAVGFQTDVVVQMLEDFSFVLQFQNVEVGDYHGDVECDQFSTLSIEHFPLGKHVAYLEKPFKITMDGTENIDVLSVQREEPLWITNIKRAMIDVFPLSALWREIKMGGGDKFLRPNFGSKHDLIGGHCMNWYSVNKLPDAEAAREEKLRESLVEEDVQHEDTASSTSDVTGEVPSISDTLWTVFRVPDFDMCDGGDETIKVNGPGDTKDVYSRSTVAQYLVRGDQKGLLIERATVAGVISVFTSDKHEDRLDTFTNQTVQLKAVRRISKPISITFDTKTFDRWYFEADSRRREDGSRPSLEEVVTGYQIPSTLTGDVELLISNHLDVLESNPRNLAAKMKEFGETLAYVSYHEISRFFDKLQTEFDEITTYPDNHRFEKKIQTFLVGLIASGSESAVQFILDNIDNFGHIAYEDLYNIFFQNLQNIVQDAKLLPKIIDVAINTEWLRWGVSKKNLALSHTASLAHRLCFSEDTRNTFTGHSCEPNLKCDVTYVLDTFLGYLKKGLESEESLTKKIVYLQSLSNLGTPHTLDILTPYIVGTVDSHMDFRILAMKSLSANLMHHSLIDVVYNILNPIVDNANERSEIRSAAFLVLMSWRPGLAWWSQKALSTWQDPSQQFAGFVSSTITAIANSEDSMSAYATRVAHLAKPAPPMSLARSNVAYMNRHVYCNEKIVKESSLLWLATKRSLLPGHVVFKHTWPSMRGFSSTSETTLLNEYLYYLLEANLMNSPRYSDLPMDNPDDVRAAVNDIISQLGASETGIQSEEAVFRTVINGAVNMNYDYRLWSFPHSLIEDLAYLIPLIRHTTSLYKNLDSTIVVSTDLGLPIVIKHLDYSVMRKKHEPLDEPAEFQDLHSANTNFNVNIQISRSASVTMTTLVPWSDKFGVGTGVISEVDLDLPIAIHFGRHPRVTQVAVKLMPMEREGDEVTIIQALNLPQTFHYGRFPMSLTSSSADFKEIRRYGDNVAYERTFQLLPSSGLWLQSSFHSADLEEPNFINILRGKSDVKPCLPTFNSWVYELKFRPKASDTKSIMALYTHVTGEEEVRGHPISVSGDGPSDPLHLEEEYDRTLNLRERLGITTRNLTANSLSITLKGSGSKTYRASIYHGSQDQEMESKRQYILAAEFDSLVGKVVQPQKTCFSASVETPYVLPLTPTEEILSSDLSVNAEAQLRRSTDCKSLPESHFKFKGHFNISEYEMPNIKKELKCQHYIEDPAANAMRSLKYDIKDMVATWTPDLPSQWVSWGVSAYDTFKGTMAPELLTRDVGSQEAPEIRLYLESKIPQGTTILDSLLPTPMTSSLFGSAYCSIDDTKIRTFDGLTIPFKPDNCWKVMALHFITGGDVAKIRYTGQWEVEVLKMWPPLHFEITKDQIKVNGKGALENHPFYKVIQSHNSMLVKFLNGGAIKVTDKIEILMVAEVKDFSEGLCGKFDFEQSTEMAGPEGCIFTDPELFAHSWTLSKDGCGDSATFDQKQQELSTFRKHCPKRSFIATGLSDHYVNVTQCLDWEFQQKAEMSYSCTARIPTKTCRSGCMPTYMMEMKIPYECSQVKGMKKMAIPCMDKSYVTHFPGNCHPS